MAAKFQLASEYAPAGDQPQAIEQLASGFARGKNCQVLLGVTGSGKTFTAANVIARLQKPTLVLSHNKTLAAQLYKEFKDFFPHNAVHYFVSYYDYYQPEAYIPQRDIYIEKDASINEKIDRLRLAATSALVSREDVIVVASVSCIYGLGSPSDYKRMMVGLAEGRGRSTATSCCCKLVDIQYERNDIAFERGKFRVRGDAVEVWPAYEEFAYRIELFGDEVERSSIINPTQRRRRSSQLDELYIYPAKHFVMPEERMREAVDGIEAGAGRAARAVQDAKASCWRRSGSRRAAGSTSRCCGKSATAPASRTTRAGSAAASRASRRTRCSTSSPTTSCCVVDESHVTVPQVRGMFAGDRSRKETLVEHGFRLPSALDNRPLRFDEWEKRIKQRAVRVGDAGAVRAGDAPAARWSSRSSGRPGWSIRSSTSSRRAGRCRIWSEEIRKRAERRASARWSRR